jgi:ABC-type sugar transport system substrate-binding protein
MRRGALVSAAVCAAAGAIAYGGSASAGASPPHAAAAGPKAYSGAEAKLPLGYPTPKVNKSKHFTIGFLDIYHGLDIFAEEQQGIMAEAKKLGVTIVPLDAENSPTTQVAEFNDLLAKHVNAIIAYPVVPTSLSPELAKAKAAGIPVIATDARPDVTQPLTVGYDSDVQQELDYEAFSLAQAGEKAQRGAQFGVLGIGPPVAAVKYLDARIEYWGKKFGLKFVGEVDDVADVPADYPPATRSLLAKAPGIQELFTYVSGAGVSAGITAHSTGHSNVKVFAGQGLDQTAISAIKSGVMYGGYNLPWDQTGAQMVIGAYDELTHQHLPLSTTIGIRGQVVTKQNVSSVKPLQ